MSRKPMTRRGFYALLALIAGLAVLNLLLSGSVVGLVGAVVILVMVAGIFRGDYPLAAALGVVLILYGAGNLVVLGAVALFGQRPSLGALIWLGVYSGAMIVLGVLLRRRRVRDYLKTAPPPKEKKRRIHFFHGGWRDL